MSWSGVYINLDRSEERRRLIEEELRAAGISDLYTRMPAIDGTGANQWATEASRGAVGCFLSHLDAIRYSAGSSEWFHVIEDDIVISRFARPAIQAITTDPAYARFDVIFTNIRYPENSEFAYQLRTTFDRSVTTAPDGSVVDVNSLHATPLGTYEFVSATSYLVNPLAGERLVSTLEGSLSRDRFEPIDSALSRLGVEGRFALAVTVPFFTMQRIGVESTIQSMAARPWAIGHRMREAAIYADRDMAFIEKTLQRLEEKPASITAGVMARAYRYLVDLD